eukprot:6175379-Pleurochrysis_carterae.AAC.1
MSTQDARDASCGRERISSRNSGQTGSKARQTGSKARQTGSKARQTGKQKFCIGEAEAWWWWNQMLWRSRVDAVVRYEKRRGNIRRREIT